jgi:hypothetical protein
VVPTVWTYAALGKLDELQLWNDEMVHMLQVSSSTPTTHQHYPLPSNTPTTHYPLPSSTPTTHQHTHYPAAHPLPTSTTHYPPALPTTQQHTHYPPALPTTQQHTHYPPALPTSTTHQPPLPYSCLHFYLPSPFLFAFLLLLIRSAFQTPTGLAGLQFSPPRRRRRI